MKAKLSKLHYCRTSDDRHNIKPPRLDQQIFLGVVTVLLILNFIGTAHDLMSADDVKKNKLLMAWSIKANWKKLITINKDGDQRLSDLQPLQGFRVLILTIVISIHAVFIHYELYLQEPRDLEQIAKHPLAMIVENGTAAVHSFILISNFLLAYNLLIYSQKNSISLSNFPKFLLDRIIRISPVYIFIVSYAATWWPSSGDGPLWPTLVAAEAEVCRRKFWAQTLYVNNLVLADQQCLVQTWFLAVDMQLYLLAMLLTILVIRYQIPALPLYGVLVPISCVFNSVIAYIFDFKSMVYFMFPRFVSNMFSGVSSFPYLYMSFWSGLPACFMGLFMAHLHFKLQEKNTDLGRQKWFVYLNYVSVPLIFAWMLLGNWIQYMTSKEFTIFFVGVEKPVFVALVAILLLGMFHRIKSIYRYLWSLRVWVPMARMSLSVLMVHWCINMTVVASRPHTATSSILNLVRL